MHTLGNVTDTSLLHKVYSLRKQKGAFYFSPYDHYLSWKQAIILFFWHFKHLHTFNIIPFYHFHLYFFWYLHLISFSKQKVILQLKFSDSRQPRCKGMSIWLCFTQHLWFSDISEANNDLAGHYPVGPLYMALKWSVSTEIPAAPHNMDMH